MAVSINTVQRSPRSTGASELSAAVPKSPIGMPILAACSSIKLPVPAAHILFIWKSVTFPLRMLIYLLSCPPISNTVSASGTQCTAPSACAVISSIIESAPSMRPTRSRPDPVTPTDVNLISPKRSLIELSPLRTAASGLPAVRRYW